MTEAENHGVTFTGGYDVGGGDMQRVDVRRQESIQLVGDLAAEWRSPIPVIRGEEWELKDS